MGEPRRGNVNPEKKPKGKERNRSCAGHRARDGRGKQDLRSEMGDTGLKEVKKTERLQPNLP